MTVPHVQSGARVDLRARDWNELADTANWHAQHKGDTGGDTPRRPREPDEIDVYNASGSDWDRWDVVALTGSVIDPTTDLETWAQPRIAMTAATPSDCDTGRLAILLDPIPAGQIGRAVVSGAVQAIVNVSDPGHGYARAVADSRRLVSTDDSRTAIQILWAMGTGETPCIVRLSNALCPTCDSSSAQPAGIWETDVDCIDGRLIVYRRLVSLTFDGCVLAAVPGEWIPKDAGCCDCPSSSESPSSSSHSSSESSSPSSSPSPSSDESSDSPSSELSSDSDSSTSGCTGFCQWYSDDGIEWSLMVDHCDPAPPCACPAPPFAPQYPAQIVNYQCGDTPSSDSSGTPSSDSSGTPSSEESSGTPSSEESSGEPSSEESSGTPSSEESSGEPSSEESSGTPSSDSSGTPSSDSESSEPSIPSGSSIPSSAYCGCGSCLFSYQDDGTGWIRWVGIQGNCSVEGCGLCRCPFWYEVEATYGPGYLHQNLELECWDPP